jgi:hypothetical protein
MTAEALISIGCDPNAAPLAHPYAIAMAGKDPAIARLFSPYWTGPERPPDEKFTPQIEVHGGSASQSKLKSTFATMNVIENLSRQGPG